MKKRKPQKLVTVDQKLDWILEKMATKDDLAGVERKMATKDDLAGVESKMATKEDLNGFATKDEVEYLAMITYREFQRMEDKMDEGFNDLKERISILDRNFLSFKYDFQGFGNRLTALEKRFE